MAGLVLPQELILYITDIAKDLEKYYLFEDIKKQGRRREQKQEALQELRLLIRERMGLNVTAFNYPPHGPLL